MQQVVLSERVCLARGQLTRNVQPRTGSAAAAKVPARSVALRAAAEEVKPVSANGSAKPSAAALDFDELTELIKMVHATDIVELELKSSKFKLSVKKKEALEAAEPTIIHMPAPQQGYAQAPMQQAPPAPAPAPAAAAAPAAAPAPPPPAALEGVEVKSPMAGTMYRSPAPGEPAFVKEGDTVVKGQTICIVEAMKLMNEITNDDVVSGTVVKILAENGKPVVPGQPLMLIKPT